MVEKGFNSWRGRMEGASGSAVGQVSKRVKAKELAPRGGGWGKTNIGRKVGLMMRTLSARWTWLLPADSGGPP